MSHQGDRAFVETAPLRAELQRQPLVAVGHEIEPDRQAGKRVLLAELDDGVANRARLERQVALGMDERAERDVHPVDRSAEAHEIVVATGLAEPRVERELQVRTLVLADGLADDGKGPRIGAEVVHQEAPEAPASRRA